MRKRLLHFIMIFCSAAAFAQAIYDGPHLLYDGGKAWVKSVNNGIATAIEVKDKKVEVKFENSNLDFSVPLRKNLKNEPSVFRQPKKMFVVSDLEGQFEGFRAILLANKVIDKEYNWIYGKGHLVICGDLFDRGSSVTEIMWLLYKLEVLAKKSGGYVHTILGNHDIMNLSGDLRYLHPKYLESSKLMGVDYMSLFSTNSELGRWLRTKNTIEKIGENLCMHAGVSPVINELGYSVKEINELSRPFYDQVKRLKGVGDQKVDPFFIGKSSLFWYRGYFIEPKATEAEVNNTLELFKVNRIIAGHTIIEGNVAFYYGGKVLGVDVNRHKGDHQAAVYENGKWFAVDDKGKSRTIKFQ